MCLSLSLYPILSLLCYLKQIYNAIYLELASARLAVAGYVSFS